MYISVQTSVMSSNCLAKDKDLFQAEPLGFNYKRLQSRCPKCRFSRHNFSPISWNKIHTIPAMRKRVPKMSRVIHTQQSAANRISAVRIQMLGEIRGNKQLQSDANLLNHGFTQQNDPVNYDFFSMGMFCEDQIHMPSQSFHGIVGGAGTYALLGAGIVRPLRDRKKIGFICDKGCDFNPHIYETMRSWGFGIEFREDSTRQTTKAWNMIVDNEERLFKYLSPKRQIFAEELVNRPSGQSRCVHLICSPDRARQFLLALKSQGIEQKYVWEPVPTQTSPADFALLKTVMEMGLVDLLSPNSLEAASLVNLPEPTTQEGVESLVESYYKFAPTVVIRCGALGSYLRTPTVQRWYPAYFDQNPERVIDPTGAGNAFCGGIGVGLVTENGDWDRVMALANVGASFMIEQVGPPIYDANLDTWNGDDPMARITRYLNRLKLYRANNL